jgi:hypothetical protein
MRSRTLCSTLVCAVLPICGLLAARADTAPTLSPPPEGDYRGAARSIASFFRLYYGYAQDPEFCVLGIRGAEESFQRNADAIATLAGPERRAFASYFQDQLMPYFARSSAGVEGLGTYPELIAKREEAIAWFLEHQPHGPATTVSEITAYAAAERAYLERAATESAWVEKAFGASACLRWAARRSNELPELSDFELFRTSWVAESAVRAELRQLRAPWLPTLTVDRQAPRRRVGKDAFATVSGLGTELLAAAANIKAIDEEDAKAALLEVWASKLDPVEAALVRAQLTRRAEARAAAVEFFAERLPLMAMPAGTEDPLGARAAKALGTSARALSVRALSAMDSFSEDRSEFAGMVFRHPVRFSGKTFSVGQVRRGAPRPDWPRGIGGDDLCSLVILTAVTFGEGANVSIGKWITHSETTYPIECSRKNATYGQ